MDEEIKNGLVNEITRQVMGQLKTEHIQITLECAKQLMELVERRSEEMNLKSVIAVCGADGNMIAVHRMEGAYLASFDVAMKKAYTAAAVQMTTKKLGELAQPGGMFYGVDKADQGRLIVFGGGVPLYAGQRMVGALGVSGGTSQQDHELAEFGQKMFGDMIYGQL